MRATLAIVIAVLTFGQGYRPVLGQTGAGWLYSIHMFDALTGWAVEAEGSSGVVARGAVESVVRTTDGGIHWRDVTPPDPPGLRIRRVYSLDVLNSLVAWASATPTASSDPTVLFHTVDGGQTWQHVTAPGHWWGVPPVNFIYARDGWLVGKNGIYRSADGGQTWIKIASAAFAGQTVNVTFLDATTGWINGYRGAGLYLYVTHDGGNTWRQQKLPRPPEVRPCGITRPPTFFTARDGVLPEPYAISNGVGVVFYVTHDGGTTWTHTTPLPKLQNYRDSSFADVNHGWVIDIDGTLFATSDGGRQWTTIRPGPPFTSVSVGYLDFISPQVGWATGLPLFLPVLLKTVDGGRTWAPVAYTISRQ